MYSKVKAWFMNVLCRVPGIRTYSFCGTPLIPIGIYPVHDYTFSDTRVGEISVDQHTITLTNENPVEADSIGVAVELIGESMNFEMTPPQTPITTIAPQRIKTFSFKFKPIAAKVCVATVKITDSSNKHVTRIKLTGTGLSWNALNLRKVY